MSKPMELGALRVGSYVIVDDEPCRIVDYTKSKPGKHGSAKARRRRGLLPSACSTERKGVL
jgi:translation elongation factor P/translation initiation factor 5A